MLIKREKFLLELLFWIAVAVGLGFFFFPEMEKYVYVQEKIELMEEQIKKYGMKAANEEGLIAKKERLSKEFNDEWFKFYTSQEIDPYRFSIIIRNYLVSRNLQIERYHTLEVGEHTWLEFSIRGNVLDFISFLEKVSTHEKYCTISFVSINAREASGKVNAVLRITYETIDEVAR